MFIQILLAMAILLGIGIISALILSVASHYMRVRVNDTLRRVRECLPGANCGACGYAGCDAYAEALFKKEAKVNLCVPGGSDIAEKTARILGIDASDVEKMKAYVHCNGTREFTTSIATYNGPSSCEAMCLACGGPMACKYGCLGCGDCAKICPSGAIRIRDNIAEVIFDKCISCGLCVKECPKKIISLIPQKGIVAIKCSSHDIGNATRKKCKVGCIACRKCEKICPSGAISVKNNLAKIDYEKCTQCGMCFDVCPVRCIEKIFDALE